LKRRKLSIAGRKQLGLPSRTPNLNLTAPEKRASDLDSALCHGAGIRGGGQTAGISVKQGETGTHVGESLPSGKVSAIAEKR
jgi:hypothetical protein